MEMEALRPSIPKLSTTWEMAEGTKTTPWERMNPESESSFLGNLMIVGVEVMEVTGGERSDVRIKLTPAITPEGQVAHEI